jgi:hypothetical protein
LRSVWRVVLEGGFLRCFNISVTSSVSLGVVKK